MTDRVSWRNRIVGHGVKPADQFQAHPDNWRGHPQHQREAVHGSLNELGWVDTVIENVTTGHVVDGHERIWQALQNDNADVPYIQVELTEEEERLALAILDPITNMATTDAEKLDALLADIRTGDAALQAMLSELAKGAGLSFGEEPAGDPGPQLDRAAELREKWGTARGQMWEMPARCGGVHRVMCGDSTDEGDVGRLMDGEKAALFETDPPYGVDYSAIRNSQAELRRTTVEYDDIASDVMSGKKLQEFLEKCFSVWLPSLADNAAWYLWHAQLTQGFFAAAAAAAADILIHRQIIWVKPSFIFGRGDYHWRHELCFYGWRRGNRPPFYGEHNQDTVWDIGIGGGSSGGTHKDHPTQKPLELWEIPIKNHTKTGQIVADPFSGSGTSIIACERLGRRCRGVEIEPKYVAVTLQRWQDMTGLEPVRVE